MPQHPTIPRTEPATADPARSAQPEPSTTTMTTTATARKAADLTVNKVLAGAGAAATTAVLGSYFGAAGTVTGAALGSVASTLATTLYQRSLDRTRDTIVARVRVTPGRRTDLADAPTAQLTVPVQRVPAEEGTTRLRVEPALRRPRRAWLWVGATVLVFVLGMLAVTGIEWAKGSTLTTGDAGTSVGRVLTPEPEESGTSESGEESDTDEPDTDESSGDEPSTDDSGTDDTGAGDPDAQESNTSGGESTQEPVPTPEPDAGSDRNGSADEDDGTASEGDPLPAPVAPVPAAPQNR